MSYTPAQKRAYAIRMQKKRDAAAGAKRKAQPSRARATRTTTTTRAARSAKSSNYTDGTIGEAIGGGIGAMLGGLPGSLIGASFGKGAHKMFKMLTGFGDYYVAENSLLRGGMSPPEIVNSTRTGGFIVRHREYIKDIDAATAFTIESFPLNPGQAQTFPWLSQVAGSFEQYRLRGAVFEFKSLSSDAVLSTATSSALGAIVMATDYNVLGGTFANKMEMENYEYACSDKPSRTFLHPIECKRSLTPVTELYVRTDPVPSNADPRLYDLGLFQIAAVGMQAASGVAGELWVTYEVELLKPKINVDEVQGDHLIFGGTVSGSVPLGSTSATLSSGSTIGGTISTTLQRYSFPLDTPVGAKYLFNYENVGAAGVAIVIPSVTATGCTVLNFYNGGAQAIVNGPPTGATSAGFSQDFVVQITDTVTAANPAYVQWGTGGTLPNGSVARDLVVTRLPDTI